MSEPASGAAGRIPVVYLIDKLHRAGAQNHVCQLATHLDRERFAPQVCCLSGGGPLAEQVRSSGVPVTVLGVDRIYGPAAVGGLRRLVRILRRDRVSVLHTYLVSSNIFGTVAGRLAKTPVIFTSRRDTGFSRNWRLGLIEEWLINPRTTGVVAVSEAAAVAARRERNLGGGKVVTIWNGIEIGRWEPERYDGAAARRQWEVRDDEKTVGIVANLSPVKGHADLLDAVARVAAEVPQLKLFLIGDGPLRGSLEERARSLGIAERVVMTGSRSDLPEMLSMIDVAVLCSHTEGMSNVLLEYMAMGLPVVATAVGGNVELIDDGVTGRLVPARDPVALGAAIVSLLRDPAEAVRLGAAARQFVRENLTLERMIDRYEQLYVSSAAGMPPTGDTGRDGRHER